MMMNRILSFFAGVLLLFAGHSLAQEEKASVQLLDTTTKIPIVGAHYHYKSQQGVSDAQGVIRLKYTDTDTLFLSHISYGTWALTAEQVRHAFRAAVIYKEQEVLSFQPITVFAMRSKMTEVEELSLNVQDKLSHDAGAVLNQIPMISSIRKSGSYGFDPVLRGFKFDQINLVIDGVQTSSAACPNRMDPPASQVAPNMMEQIEIFKGPHSFRYGTSFGGTINFKSVPTRFSQGHTVYSRLSSSTESNGGIYRTEGVLGMQSANYDFGLFGSLSKGSDYEDGEAISIPSAFQRASIGMNLGWRLSEKQQLSLSVTYNNAKDTDFAALPMDLRSDKTWLLSAKHTLSVNRKHLKSWDTVLFATRVNHLMDNLGKNLVPRMVDAETDANTFNYGGRSEGIWAFEQGRLYTGLDLRIERANGERTRAFLMGPMAGKTVYDDVWNDGQVARASVFGEYHHSFTAFRLILSGRLEYNHASANDVNDKFLSNNPETSKTQINPNISIGGLKDFSNGLSAGVWLGRAQRSGSITERYINSYPVGVDPYDMLGNPALNPEINNQIDLTLGYKSAGMSLDIGVFASFLQDYISSEIDPNLIPIMPSSPGVRRYLNIKDALMRGFEITWAQRLFTGHKQSLSVAYTYGQDRVRNEPLPEIAALDVRYALSGSYLDTKLRPTIAFRHVLKQERISTAFGETKTPSFSVVDFAITYQVLRNLGATAGVKNLFDEAYYEHLNRPLAGQSRAIFAPGRNIYLSLFVDMM